MYVYVTCISIYLSIYIYIYIHVWKRRKTHAKWSVYLINNFLRASNKEKERDSEIPHISFVNTSLVWILCEQVGQVSTADQGDGRHLSLVSSPVGRSSGCLWPNAGARGLWFCFFDLPKAFSFPKSSPEKARTISTDISTFQGCNSWIL